MPVSARQARALLASLLQREFYPVEQALNGAASETQAGVPSDLMLLAYCVAFHAQHTHDYA